MRPPSEHSSSSTPLLVLPLLVVQRANLSSLQPSADAVQMERMVTYSPRDGTLLSLRGQLVGLTFDAEVHDVVSTNGARVNLDVPRPQCHRIPLLDLEPFRRRVRLLWRDCG